MQLAHVRVYDVHDASRPPTPKTQAQRLTIGSVRVANAIAISSRSAAITRRITPRTLSAPSAVRAAALQSMSSI